MQRLQFSVSLFRPNKITRSLPFWLTKNSEVKDLKLFHFFIPTCLCAWVSWVWNITELTIDIISCSFGRETVQISYCAIFTLQDHISKNRYCACQRDFLVWLRSISSLEPTLSLSSGTGSNLWERDWFVNSFKRFWVNCFKRRRRTCHQVK